MTALSSYRNTLKMKDTALIDLLFIPIADNVKVYVGGMAALDINGRVVPAGSTNAVGPVVGKIEVPYQPQAIGVNPQPNTIYDNTVAGHSAGALTVAIRQGVFKYANSSSTDLIAAANVGQDCYAADDQTVALTSNSGARTRAGKIVLVDSDGVWVQLGLSYTPGNQLAGLAVTVPAPASAATTGTAASVALSSVGQPGGASSGGATNNTGGVGSNDTLASGVGGAATGAATGTNTGGAGGTMSVASGAGGAASGATTASTAGAGGALSISGGAGGVASGTATTNTGGAGASATISGGVGGASSGGTTNNGGAGGAASLIAGNGGNGTTTGGAGGSVAITAGNAGTGGNAAAGNITITPGTATGSGAAGSVTVGASVAAARAGVRIGASRVIVGNKPTSAVDCTGGLTATVTQVLEGGIFTSATSVTLTLPTAQGASGIVQNLPGTPAVGDCIQIVLAMNHATNTLTLAAGAGSTIFGIATMTNGNRIWTGRITSVTPGSETITWY